MAYFTNIAVSKCELVCVLKVFTTLSQDLVLHGRWVHEAAMKLLKLTTYVTTAYSKPVFPRWLH